VAQLFHPYWNSWSKASLLIAFGILAVLGWGGWLYVHSSYRTEIGEAHEQPVPFSHEHHVRKLGIDCRYCHTAVENAPFAGIPTAKTCMNCHSHVWADSPMLEPVRESFRTGKPLKWTRVHDLPDFVRFDHSIHVQKGIACASCHGAVDRMPLMTKAETLHMGWCLECHRNPEKFVRPRDKVFQTEWDPEKDGDKLRAWLVDEHHLKSMTNCSVCHQ
jgi:hypothetical protein